MTQVKLYQVPVDQLLRGMYVSQLDRPWLETPFLFQGFKINSKAEIAELQKYCDHVYVDIEQGIAPKSYDVRSIFRSRKPPAPTNETSLNIRPSSPRAERDSKIQKELESMFPHRQLKHYVDQTNIAQEMPAAEIAFNDLNAGITNLLNDIKNQRSIDLEKINQAVDPMIDSIIRNPDACMWLARMKSKDSYAYKHSIGTSVWALSLGRQIGLPKIDLKHLAVGASLCDVGRMKLPDELLNKTERLTEAEFALLRSHVELGIKALQQSSGITGQVLEIVSHHHERYDGKGYPKQLKKNQIPVLARIAAIADCYDAMTSDRVYAAAISPSEAVQMLYQWRNKDFQSALIEEFIQAVGLYPVGTVVELSDGSVGIVSSEYRTHRLKPKLLRLLDSNKKPLGQAEEVDLFMLSSSNSDSALHILKSLSPDSYGLDPEKLFL